MICSVHNLNITLREGNLSRTIVRNISFSLGQGASLGIVGESGSGKTITALSMLQLLPPGMFISGGEIHWYGSEGVDTDLAGLDEKGSNTRKLYSGPEYQNLDIYQVNCTYYSALECNDDS